MLLVLASIYIIIYISILKMVSTLLCSWNNENWENINGHCEDNTDPETRSSLEDSFGIDKPVVISNDHIALPDVLQQSKDSEDIFTKLLGATSKGSQNDDNSEEIFNSHKNRNIKADLNRRNIVDKVFEKYDDPYAKFPVTKTPKTPGPRTPRHTLVSPTKTPASKPWKYITLEEKESRRKAAIEGQRDFCQVLIKKGIDPEEYVSSVFKTSKKNSSGKKINFECSTPKTDTFSECVTTPFTDRSNINTPISGIKKLPNYCGETTFTPNYLNYSLSSRYSDLSLNETYSPIHDLPPETKSTLLSGIICYVDVRSANEDMTASVQEELLTLGARIEKNFTKKVTHVVFKEGRVSTYLKAKKEGVPLVSVLWIEACKRVRGVADPALHPPRRMEKYENILPFQTLKKRRLKFFNPNSKIRKNILENYNDPTFVPTLNGKKLANKKAATVCKDKVSSSSEDKENKGIRKFCTKKLLFNKCEDLFTDHEDKEGNHIIEQRKEPTADDSSLDSMPDIKSAVLRRKSAPAKIIFKKNPKQKVTEVTQKKDDLLISYETGENILDISKVQDSNITNNEEVKGLDEVQKLDMACPDPAKKKRKLYNPEEVYVSLDEGQVTQESIVNTPIKRPRTKATANRQLVKLALARKRGNNKIKTEPDDDDCGSSPSTFVDDKATTDSHKNKNQRERRSIVFTSIHRRELPKYVEKVKELGRCIVENEVTKRTTHVVCNGPRRTLNLIKGIARGCWILDIKWFEDSVKEEKWLPEDSYILSNEFPCITECCRERRGLRTSHVVDIFKDLGRIYVSKAANPPKKDLDQLLKMCCATVSKSSSSANVIVGGQKPNLNPDGVWVSEKWIIDSITHNALQPYNSYILSVCDKAKDTADSQE